MKKVNNKKGFTLAELLVVLAILAVLVAVAVPMFTGALNNANKTARDANVRAIRAAAVNELLVDNDKEHVGETGPWMATGEIGADGEMVSLDVVEDSGAGTASVSYPAGNAVAGTYKVPINSLS